MTTFWSLAPPIETKKPNAHQNNKGKTVTMMRLVDCLGSQRTKKWNIRILLALLAFNLFMQFIALFMNASSSISMDQQRELLSHKDLEDSSTINNSTSEISTTTMPLTTSNNGGHCGCPQTCHDDELRQVRNGNKWSCGARMQYLKRRHDLEEPDACYLASTELDEACGSACNPKLCQQKLPMPSKGQNVLVIASVPKDEKHAVALWTSLECLATKDNLQIVLSVPKTTRRLVEPVVERARRVLGFTENNIHVHYNVNNDRYDVGLWCNALLDTVSVGNDTKVALVNDSVFFMRRFPDVFEALEKNSTLELVSLSYSNTGGNYWIESVLRGFSAVGIERFKGHSCFAHRRNFCRGRALITQKRCIVQQFEMGLITHFNESKVLGLYPSDPPPTMPDHTWKTWVQNPEYWRDILVKDMNFPVSKVNRPDMIDAVTDPRLSQCTQHANLDFFRDFNYSQLE